MKKRESNSTASLNQPEGRVRSMLSTEEILESAPEDLLFKLFTGVSPRELGTALHEISVEQLIEVVSGQVSSGPDSTLRQLSQWLFKNRASFNIKSDVERLADLGVCADAVAPIMLTVQLSRGFDGMFGQFGDKRTRRSRCKKLLAPIPVLQELATLFGEVPSEASAFHVARPTQIISDLKFLSSMQRWGEWLYEFLGANSLLEVSKFALASLVREVTGKFLDREVSNLTGAALWDHEYDENRHRVWRIGNYKRLEQNVPIATRFAIALNTVVARQEAQH